MNPSHFLGVLRARWLPALVVFGLVFGAAIVFTLIAPKRYTATATLVLDIKPDPVSSMLYGGATSPAMMNTQVEVLRSDRVAQRVVRNLKLTEQPEVRKQWEAGSKGDGQIENWLVDSVQRGLEVQVVNPGGNVLNVSYKGTDPQYVATLANAFVQAYLETAVELRVDPAREYSGFFGKQVDEARASLEAAQMRLSKFQQAQGIIATDDRFDVDLVRPPVDGHGHITNRGRRHDLVLAEYADQRPGGLTVIRLDDRAADLTVRRVDPARCPDPEEVVTDRKHQSAAVGRDDLHRIHQWRRDTRAPLVEQFDDREVELLVPQPTRHQQEGVELAFGQRRPEGHGVLTEVLPGRHQHAPAGGDQRAQHVQGRRREAVGQPRIGDEHRHLHAAAR